MREASAKTAFRYAAVSLTLGAIAHVIGHLLGPDAIGFMGAPPDVVQGAIDGTGLYYAMILGIIGLLLGLAFLAWTAPKGRISRFILWVFAAIFTFRGLFFALFLFPAIQGNFGPDPTKFWFHVFASLFVLSIGLSLFFGLWKTRISRP